MILNERSFSKVEGVNAQSGLAQSGRRAAAAKLEFTQSPGVNHPSELSIPNGHFQNKGAPTEGRPSSF